MTQATEAGAAPSRPTSARRAAIKNGQPQRSDDRLFMQLLAFGGCTDAQPLAQRSPQSGVSGVLYEDVNDPRGVALLTFSAGSGGVRRSRAAAAERSRRFATLVQKPEYTMLGRTYAIGYEPDLEECCSTGPAGRCSTRPGSGPSGTRCGGAAGSRSFRLRSSASILAEHGAIGMSFGAGDYAHDIRLACHGLDKDDNDFVVGLIGKELFPLSAVVQTMRKTQQTSLYLESLGPFFVGRAVWQAE